MHSNPSPDLTTCSQILSAAPLPRLSPKTTPGASSEMETNELLLQNQKKTGPPQRVTLSLLPCTLTLRGRAKRAILACQWLLLK